jgi:uncharacterized OB-fold protein
VTDGRPLPEPDELSAPFWAAAAKGRLEIQRCAGCRRYHFPAVVACPECAGTDLAYEQVSGRGRVFSVTETAAGARHGWFQQRLPYLVGLVELEEQPGLLLLTNFPDASRDAVWTGAEVRFRAERVTAEIGLPQFSPEGAGVGA